MIASKIHTNILLIAIALLSIPFVISQEDEDVTKRYYWTAIGGNQPAYWEPNEENLAVSKISFTPIHPVNQVFVEIRKLFFKKHETDESNELVYDFFQIYSSKLDEIEDSKLEYKVSKDWVEENNINTESIKLHVYSNEKWHTLDSDLISEDEEDLAFSANIVGFSHYAILASKKPADDSEYVPEIILDDVTDTAVDDENEVPTEEEVLVPKIEEEKGFPWITAATISSLLTIIGYVFLKKREK